ncbi:MAG: type II secretion system F family protein [Thermoanaerobacteraceae bacterium]|nr:type II secretion system F family protein [Thermoanaerobacteraceae bacterium]
MPSYEYRARDEAGRLIIGTLEGDSSASVRANLREKKLYPVDIKEKAAKNDVSLTLLKAKVKVKDIAIFCRQFASLIKAGVSVVTCIDILRGQTENKRLRDTLMEIYDDVQKGKTLSDTMGKYPDVFPPLLTNMVEAGEVSGTLDTIMDRMAVHFENQNRINQKIRSALTYPIVVACVAIGVVIFLITFVLPTFIGLFQSAGAVLPLPTRILIGLSNILRNYWYILIIAAGGIYVVTHSYASSKEGRYRIDGLKLTLPIIGPLNRKIITARFTRTLGILIQSGVPVLRSIEVTDRVIGNSVVSKALSEVSEALSKGSGLSGPLKASGIFPPMVYQMIEVGENSGTLDDMLLRIADFFDQEVETGTTQLTTMLEPAIILFMAVIIGFIVISIALPMFQMMNYVGY